VGHDAARTPTAAGSRSIGRNSGAEDPSGSWKVVVSNGRSVGDLGSCCERFLN
jgi:hypothetical protein